MPSYTLPVGFEIPHLTTDIDTRCQHGGPFRHGVEYQLERFRDPEQRRRAVFKLTQMCNWYTDTLMQQFPELQSLVSHARLSAEIMDALLHSQS